MGTYAKATINEPFLAVTVPGSQMPASMLLTVWPAETVEGSISPIALSLEAMASSIELASMKLAPGRMWPYFK